ncbi:hypothetical protein ACVWZA_002809 [Sphingomonas sp. UYAg733]
MPSSRGCGKLAGNMLFCGFCGKLREKLRENRHARTGKMPALNGKIGKWLVGMICSLAVRSIQDDPSEKPA